MAAASATAASASPARLAAPKRQVAAITAATQAVEYAACPLG